MRKQRTDHTPAVGTGSSNSADTEVISTSSSSKLIEQIHNIVNQHMIDAVSSMTAGIPEFFSRKADTCKNPDEKDWYIEQLKLIHAECDNINRGFFIALNEKLRPANHAIDPVEEELSLVSEDEMEEMVAMTTMHARVMNQFGEEINHLETRLEYLEISTDAMIEKESLSPIRFAEVLQAALKPLNLEVKSRLQLFMLFDLKVASWLGSLYKQVNALLIEAGIMPTIMLKTTRHEEHDEEPEMTVRTANYYNPQENVATNFIPRTPADMAFFANQFMRGEFTASEAAINLPESFRKPVSKHGADGKNYYERKDVVKALTRLQNKILKLGKEPDQVSFEQIKRTLFTDIGKENGGAVTRQVNVLDERSIDFVGLMYDAITHDDSISTIIKNLLLRLQIPVIKAAMSDTELFQRENHPTREVLDLVTEAGKGINDVSDRMYNEIETIVDGVLQDYDADISSFSKAAAELHELIESERQIAQENERREQQAVMVAHAREVVVDEVRHISSNKIIPRNVLPLITKSWPSLMMNRYIRHGNDSWQWLESVMLMKLMVKCLQPIKNSTQWETVWNNHMALVEAVHDELQTSKQEKTSVEQQVENLKNTFVELLDAYGYKLVEDATLSNDTMFTESDTDSEQVLPENHIPAANDEPEDEDNDALRAQQLEEIARHAQEKLSQLPSMVHPGVWFEIYNGDGKAVRRLKLSVVLTEVAKLVFVDRKGVKVIEKDAADFAAELGGNKSRFIADHSTFEHALGQVIHSIAA